MLKEGQVDSEGELFPPKEIRDKLGLKPHTKVIYKVENDRLIVEPVPSLEEVFDEPPAIEITLEELKAFRRKLSKEMES